MFLRMEQTGEIKLIGMHMRMSFAENKTTDLWRSFMPRRKEIPDRKGPELFSVEIYNSTYFFQKFDPETQFEKWAAVEVTNLLSIPDKMESLIIPQGKYAVFLHKGPVSEGKKTYTYIFTSWLPASNFQLDDRPHFALMGEKYKNDSADSEEEIWIPVKEKASAE